MLFDATRRELLRFSGMGLAATAAPALAMASGRTHTGSTTPAMAGSPARFDVRQFGATGDGKTVDSPAINKAIEAAAAAGGGTVTFPAGSYLCFSVRLKSHVHLELMAGTAIIAADSPKPGDATGYNGGTYDAAEPNLPWEPYQDYGHNHWHNSLLWGEDLDNVAITGPGLIWGRGLSNGRDHVMLGYPFRAEQAGVGNKAIALKNCRNVLFRDFAILKGGHFGLLLTGVDNLTIDGLVIDTDRDGMDIDCCRNVRVANCTVNSPWDDGICPKSSYALGYARSTDNVTITNCYVTGTYQLGTVLDGTFKKFTGQESAEMRPFYTGRIKCGTESNGGFRNITISNCVFEGCHGLALESEDGALLEDIAVSNLTMRDLISGPLFLRLGARLRGPQATTKVGTLRRVTISNIASYNSASKLCAIASGVPQAAIEDLRIANIFMEHQGGAPQSYAGITPPENEAKYPDPAMFGPMPSQGFFFRHVKRLEVSHTEVAAATPDPRPAFYLEDVERADFIAVTAPAGQPAFRLKDVRDLRVRISRAAADATLDKATDQTL
ncbi:glycoside hydrolase family 28 protein [Silvibacterium dinghuense]|uniref:Glycoside hydrolase family 28 protein n=1 Tax=Silvibacterium dinghuense TaxID=1560006 RepID=A0A4Q1SJN9_9BACT|nr:glycoside hydrolase family 28 protein [Silvibacterium dinghuense]RXS97645.1 glycoside hydrolase family 28 protein [Silvibacterium dinghuense]GGH00791.1 exo-poly-alpha-D-galacturonosidase [Silvibacterium dinghuense]